MCGPQMKSSLSRHLAQNDFVLRCARAQLDEQATAYEFQRDLVRGSLWTPLRGGRTLMIMEDVNDYGKVKKGGQGDDDP